VNTAIWLADPPEETLVIFDNTGWYCDVANNQSTTINSKIKLLYK
jgi:hypothetical protein